MSKLRVIVLSLAALALASALTVSTEAAHASPPYSPRTPRTMDHLAIVTPVGSPLGRYVITVTHYELGQARCSVQVEQVDTNRNGLADALRGRSACLEQFGVASIRMYWTKLQVDFVDTWTTVAIQNTDVVDSHYAVQVTPPDGYCVSDRQLLTYRTQAKFVIRWDDGTLTTVTETSHQAPGLRRTQSHPDCHDSLP